MIKLSEKGILKDEMVWKLGLLHQILSQAVNAKQKFSREIKSTSPVNTRITRNKNSLTADKRKFLWSGEKIKPATHSLKTKSKTLTLLSYMKVERGEEAAEEKSEAHRGWFMRFKERSCLYNLKVQGEAPNADTEAPASYPKDLARIIDEGGYIKQQIFGLNKTPFLWMKMLCRTFTDRSQCMALEFQSSSWLSCQGRVITLIQLVFKLKPVFICNSKKPRALKQYAKSTVPSGL